MACLSDRCPMASVNFTAEGTGQHCVQCTGTYDCFVFTKRLLTGIILYIAVSWQCMVLQYYNQMMATLTPDVRGCGTAWGLGTGLGMVNNTLKVLNWKKTIMEVYSENGYSWLPYSSRVTSSIVWSCFLLSTFNFLALWLQMYFIHLHNPYQQNQCSIAAATITANLVNANYIVKG